VENGELEESGEGLTFGEKYWVSWAETRELGGTLTFGEKYWVS
jgi:hypothetical protein